MNLNNVYENLKEYDFSNIDICDKEYAISSFICHIKGISKSEYIINKNMLDISENEVSILKEYLNRLVYDKIPLQYILGKTYIFNEEYIVNNDVLIPRQDTEILIEKAIEYIDKYNLKTGLDLCCGSGVIGISTAINSSLANITFLDISDGALDVTRQNIIHNNMKKENFVVKSDLFNELMTSNNKYDIIMSNPPYIKSKDIDNLSDYVKAEPMLALDGGEDGLEMYKNIIDNSRLFLNDLGYIILEIGYDQMDDITNIINKYEEYEIVEKIKDLNSNDRVIICRFHKI